MCGLETEKSSGWFSIRGPIKGSFAFVNNTADAFYDYVTEFGMRVDDPCQAVDNAD